MQLSKNKKWYLALIVLFLFSLFGIGIIYFSGSYVAASLMQALGQAFGATTGELNGNTAMTFLFMYLLSLFLTTIVLIASIIMGLYIVLAKKPTTLIRVLVLMWVGSAGMLLAYGAYNIF